MNEQDVWPLATELWEKREKGKIWCIEARQDIMKDWHIIINRWHEGIVKEEMFSSKTEVRQFLDGLEG